MSKHCKWFLLLGMLVAVLFCVDAAAQDIEAKISISADRTAAVSGKLLSLDTNLKRRNLSFALTDPEITGPRERISDLKLTRDGKDITFKKFIAGEYAGESDFDGWSYRMNLERSANPAVAAHLSWISRDFAILMLDDVLPQFGRGGRTVSARTVFDIPTGWRIASTEKHVDENSFDVADVQRSIFVVGKSFRSTPVAVNGFRFDLIADGEWLFGDAEAAQMVGEIYGSYRKTLGVPANTSVQIVLAKFPENISQGQWQAETRGRNITIVSSDMPFKTQSLQRLHEQLRHEIFHLWFPNSVNLNGNYDWFYEGFALYHSLKTGVLLNRLRFGDFLDTLSRAHDIDSSQTRRMSLIESSRLRSSGADTQVYARGLLVAFLCDLALLTNSKSKTGIENLLRGLFEKHRPPASHVNANDSILAALGEYKELQAIIAKYIRGVEKIEWRADLLAAGIENSPGATRTNLRVKEKLNGRQKAVLDELGYNNWRKISAPSR